jgi:hypothetical protein
MSEPKFTQGPWVAKDHNGCQWEISVAGERFHFIAITSQGNDEANAHLIAAGPDMYVALEQLIDDEPCQYDHHGNCQAHNLGNPCGVAMAIKALAKARGEVK